MADIPDDLELVKPEDTSDLEPVQSSSRPPGAVLDRVNHGVNIAEQFKAIGAAAKEGFGDEPVGFSPETEDTMRRIGLLHDPANGNVGPLRSTAELFLKSAGQDVDTVFRAMSAGVAGVAEFVNQGALEMGASDSDAARMKRETGAMLDWAMTRGDMNLVHGKPGMPGEKPIDQQIGKLPKPEDFQNAANVVSEGQPTAPIATKLERLYTERGLHPAEIADDVNSSPRLQQELLSDGHHLPEPYAKLTLDDGMPNPDVTPDMDLLAGRDVRPNTTARALPGEVSTRVLPNGRVVPAPEAIASYLKDFGREAGFTFTTGPAMVSKFDDLSPTFQQDTFRDVNTGEVKKNSSVFMPDTADELYKRWFGMNTAEILYHEVGHAIDLLDLREGQTRAQTGAKIADPVLRDEITAVSKKFRDQLWKENPGYNSTTHELMADGVAAWLSHPEWRDQMPLFTEKYGAKLDKYLKLTEKYMPTLKENGEWAHPNEGGAGGGAGEPPGGNGGGTFEHEPRMIEGPRMSPEDAQASILSHISTDSNVDTSKKWSWSRFYTATVDKFHPIAEAVRDSTDGKELAAENNPYKLARMFAGWSGKATHFLEKGAVSFDGYKTIGPALKEILAPVKDDMNGFRAFVAAARAKELELRGIATGFDPRAIMGYMTPETIAKYAPMMEKLVKYQNQTTAYLRDSGVIGSKAYDAMLEANKLFVPFHVAIDHAKVGIEQVGKGLEARNPIKRIEGSEAPKIDPLESIVKNTYIMVAMAEKNVVADKLVNLLTGGDAKVGKQLMIEGPKPETGTAVGQYLGEEGMGAKAAADLEETLNDLGRPDKDGEISRYVDGRRETYRINSDLANSMKGLNSETIGLVEKLMKPLTSTLRAGAVLTPDFMVRHTFRDFIYAFVTTTKGVFTPVDMVRGFTGILTKDKDFWNWQLGGGGNTSMVHIDRNYMQEDLDRLTKQTGLFTRAWNVVLDPGSSMVDKTGAVLGVPFKAAGRYIIHPLQLGTELVTSASHLAAYKKSARYMEAASTDNKANILEAAWTSRNTAVDAARIGSQMKAYNMISAFANIKIQDTDRIARSLIDDPMGTGLKLAVGITLPSMILQAINNGDSRYDELPGWEKDIFWHIITNKWEDATPAQAQQRMGAGADQVRKVGDQFQVNNGHIFRLPKPFAAGVIFGSGAEHLMNAYYYDKKGKPGEFARSLMETTVGEVLPNALQPSIDQGQNRVTFTGRTLIPANQEKLLPEYQYSEYTSETAKAIGRTISAFPGFGERADRSSIAVGGVQRALTSPILIENYVRGWTGSLGMYALQAADLGLRKAGLLPDLPKPLGTLADVPVVRAFVSRYPSANTESVQSFFDRYDKQKTFYDTWLAKAEEGDQDATARISRLGGPTFMTKLDGFKEAINAQSQTIHMVNKNPNISPSEKRQNIDGLYYGIIQSGRQAMQVMDEIDRQLKQH